MSEYFDNLGQVLCLNHNPAIYEGYDLTRFPVDPKSYAYEWELRYECGYSIRLKVSLKDLQSADNPLFKILEGGSREGLIEFMIDYDNK